MLDDDFKDFFDSDDDAFFVEASNTISDSNIPSSETLISEKHIPQKQEINISSTYFDIKKNKILLVENLDKIDSCRSIADISQSSKGGIKYITTTSVAPDSNYVVSSRNKSNFNHNAIISASNSSSITADVKKSNYKIDSCRSVSDINQSSKGGMKYVTSTSVAPDSSCVASSENKSNFKHDTIISASISSIIISDVKKNNNIPDTNSILSNSSNLICRGNSNDFAPDTTFIGSKCCNLTSIKTRDDFTPSTISVRSSSSNSSSVMDKNGFTPDTTSDSSNVTSEVKKSAFTPNASFYINNRFTPGFTPKAKKRKFAGPAGLLELFDGSNEEKSNIFESKKIPTIDNEFQHIISSQFSPEHLSLSSWQKLQTDVSSHASLHSAAKFYSIQRVLHESSKKKMPKHMVVPVLCVLLKEIKHKGSSIIPVFMDDTGEINGKIDAEVTSKFKDYIIEGTALILKKITFLCNVLILKTDNIVSIYLPDGTENRLHSLESVLDTAEPLKPLNCECLKQSHQNKNSPICTTPLRNGIPSPYGCMSHNLKISNETLNEKSINREVSTIKSSSSVNKMSPVKNMRNDAFVENLLSEDNCMEEFDELLGNLDEESFLGDL